MQSGNSLASLSLDSDPHVPPSSRGLDGRPNTTLTLFGASDSRPRSGQSLGASSNALAPRPSLSLSAHTKSALEAAAAGGPQSLAQHLGSSIATTTTGTSRVLDIEELVTVGKAKEVCVDGFWWVLVQ